MYNVQTKAPAQLRAGLQDSLFIRKLIIFGEHPVVFRCAHPIGYGLIFGKDTWKSSEFIFVRPSPRIRKDWKVFLARGSFELQKKIKKFWTATEDKIYRRVQGGWVPFEMYIPVYISF